jgi:hypothetical protein
MNVRVVFRGGVGDYFLWLTRMVKILQFHKDDNVSLAICAPWSDAIRVWSERIKGRKFDSIDVVPYGRPVPPHSMDCAFLAQDLIYYCDLWRGDRGANSVDGSLHSANSVFHHVGRDIYPELDIPGDGIGGTCVQVQGRSVGNVGQPSWWKQVLHKFPGPIRLLGQMPRPAHEYGADAHVTGPVAIYSAIKSAHAFVGIDSGFRNIAFTLKVPVLEIETPAAGYPNKDVFSPVQYRSRTRYADESITSVKMRLAEFNYLIAARLQELSE